MSNNSEYVAGLRDLADWLEAHPDLDVYGGGVTAMPHDDKETVKTWATAMKPCTKNYSDSLFQLKRMFGPIELRASFWRTAVCEKIVTTREVTEFVPDPSVDVPMVEVTKTVEDVEWVCAPVLSELEAVPS